MRKQRLKGAGMLLGLQIFIGMLFALYLYVNYINFTKEISKTEDFGAVHLLTGNENIYSEVVNQKNFIKYKGKFGYLFSGYMMSGSGIFNAPKKTEVVQIDMDLVKKTLYFNQLLKSKNIDINIYDYYLFKDIKEFDNFYQNARALSKYFDKKLNLQGMGIIDDQYQKFQSMMNAKDYSGAINFVLDMEKQIKDFYKNNEYKTKVISPIFLNDSEFQYLIKTIYEDKNGYFQKNLQKVAEIYQIDKNLILAGIVCEQLRGFYTYRGMAKELIKTNRYIMNMYDFSLGIGGIKETAAKQIELDVQENNKDIYNKYFAYTGENIDYQRTQRLTDNENYFYQFLYAGGLIYNIEQKRKKSGYDISSQPGVVLTLYNFGNPSAKQPNPLPKIGGSIIRIDGVDYTFGSLGAIMYYYFKLYM